MKYKVGDKVIIKSNLQDGIYHERDHTRYVSEEMTNYKGKKATITHKTETSYKLDIDHGKWNWFDCTLEDESDYSITVKIEVDATELDQAIEKAKELKRLLKEVKC